MMYAELNYQKVEPVPGIKATCPGCKEEVIPVCGRVKTWHFRHLKNDCDPWHEPITKWHLDWQEKWPLENREVYINRNSVTHRADVLNNKGVVLEFQHSPISKEEIKAREKFYRKMVWVFDARHFSERFSFCSLGYLESEYDNRLPEDVKHDVRNGAKVIGFCNLYARKYIYSCKSPVFLDFGGRELYNLNRYLRKYNGGVPRFVANYNYFDGYTGYNESFHNYMPIKVVSKSNFIKYFL